MVKRLNRGAYWLALLHLPGLGRSDMIKTAEFRIPSLYPGDPQEALWDYRLLPGRKRAYLLMAITPGLESLPPAGSYLPLFHAVDLKLPGRGKEVSLSEGGITDTLSRSTDDRYTLLSREENDPHPQVSPALRRRGYRGAFGGGKALHVFLIALLCLLPATSVFTVAAHRELRSRRAHLARLEERTASPGTSIGEERTLKSLSLRNRGMPPAEVSREPPDPLMILAELERLLPPETELLRLLCREERLQLELLGPEPLKAAESLRADGRFSEVSLGEIRPQKGMPLRESYRLSMRIAR